MKLAAEAGSAASFIAYSFQWLMMLTLATGAAFPLGALVEKKSGREGTGIVAIIGIIFVAMTSFTAVSFLRVSSVKTVGKPEAQSNPSPQGGKTEDVSYFLEFARADVKEVSPDILEMELKFKNKGNRDITELDYVFIAVENVHIFYKIKIREGVYFPSQGTGSTKLTWDRTKLKTPELFETIKRAYHARSLKIFGKPTRITLVDGSVIGDQT